MKKLLTIVFVFLSISTYAQHKTNPDTKQVTGFNAQYNFSYVGTYDYDLNKIIGNAERYNTTILFDIEKSGTGRVIIYFVKKTVLYVSSCYKRDNDFYFYLTNGNKVILWINEQNKVQSFTLENEADNTATIFF